MNLIFVSLFVWHCSLRTILSEVIDASYYEDKNIVLLFVSNKQFANVKNDDIELNFNEKDTFDVEKGLCGISNTLSFYGGDSNYMRSDTNGKIRCREVDTEDKKTRACFYIHEYGDNTVFPDDTYPRIAIESIAESGKYICYVNNNMILQSYDIDECTWNVFIKDGYAGFLSENVFYRVINANQILVTWSNEISAGMELSFAKCKSLDIFYKKQTQANYSDPVSVPASEQGAYIKDLEVNTLYEVFVRCINATGFWKDFSSNPVGIQVGNGSVMLEGVYHYLLAAVPNDYWKLDGVMPNILKQSVPYENNIHYGLSDKAFVSSRLFEEHGTIYMGMQNGSVLQWYDFTQFGDKKYVDHFLITFYGNRFHYLPILNIAFCSACPNYEGVGSYLSRGAYRVHLGALQLENGDIFHRAYGIGINIPPYVGYRYKDGTEIPMFGYVITEAVYDLHCQYEPRCYNPPGSCGDAVYMYELTSSDIGVTEYSRKLCQRESGKCTGIECPFAAPSNLHSEKVEQTSIDLKWDAINTDALYSPDDFGGYKIEYKPQGTNATQTKDSNDLDATLNSLQPYTMYEVRIRGHSYLGDVYSAFSDTLNIRTLSAPPDPPVMEDVTANSSCLTPSWITPDNIRGVLVGFLVAYKPQGGGAQTFKTLLVGNVNEKTICGLLPFTSYEIKIFTRNNKYNSSSSADVTTITSESAPRASPILNDVSFVDAHTMKIKWTDLKSEYWQGVPYQFRVLYRQKGALNFKNVTVYFDVHETEVTNLDGYTEYEFAIQAGTAAGFGPMGNITTQRTDEIAPVGVPQNFSGRYIDSSSIVVSWSAVNEYERKGIIIEYTVTCYSKDYQSKIASKVVTQGSEQKVEFDALEVYTVYAVNITASNSKGHGPQGQTFVRTEGEAPTTPPHNFHGYNLSSTTLVLHWEDLTDEEWIGDPEGFRIEITSLLDSNDKNVTNITYKSDVAEWKYEAHDLIPYTFYEAKIFAVNYKGASLLFSDVTLRTGEDSPLVAPSKVEVAPVVNSFSVLRIKWENPAEDTLRGIQRGVTIYVKALYSDEDLVAGDGSSSGKDDPRKRRAISPGESYTDGLSLMSDNITVDSGNDFNLTGLRGNTVYNISISANTLYPGEPSVPVQVITPEGVPTISALNVRCEPLSFSMLRLRWLHAPPAYVEGTRTKYSIYYEGDGKSFNDTIPEGMERYEALFLKASTLYTFEITSSTSVGDGPRTLPVSCTTFEAAPLVAPTNVTATSFESPTSTLVQWKHIPDSAWRSPKTGYIIFFTKASVGEIGEDFPRLEQSVSIGYQDSYTLEGLDMYGRYSIQVAARTSDDYGPKSEVSSFETCRVSHQDLIVNYGVYPPYVDHPNASETRPQGIMINLMEASILACARHCRSFNTNITVIYQDTGTDNLKEITEFLVGGNVLKIPVKDNLRISPNFTGVTIGASPGFVMLEVPDSSTEKASKGENTLLDGVAATLPLIGLYMLLNLLSGVVFWICEPTNVEYKGPGMSLAGVFEGLYLAFMTSTTVGYGDKVPNTNRGRLYTVFWSLMGLVLTGIVVGNLSSSLSSSAIASMKATTVSEKVIAVYGTTEYVFGRNKMTKFDTNVTYLTYEELLIPLRDKKVKYALVDQYVMQTINRNVTKYGLEVKKVYEYPTDFWLAAYGELQLLQVCARKYVKENKEMFDNSWAEMLKQIAARDAAEAATESSPDKTQDQLPEEEVVSYLSYEAPLYQQALLYLIILYASFFLLGCVYEVIRRVKLKKQKNKVASKADLLLAMHKDVRDLYIEVCEDFKSLTERVEVITDKLLYKHGEELIKFRDELSKLYGVNFKYVRSDDLGVPLDKIQEYINDMRNRPKEKVSVRDYLMRRTVTIRYYFGVVARRVNNFLFE